MNTNSQSRTYNSVVNSLVGIISSIVTILLNFFVRIVIIRELGDEINGIHNLFLSISHAVALIEAGFSTAMVIFLYKPIKEQSQNEIIAIMTFYKKVYRFIALSFLAICIVVNIFFIEDLVESTIPISQVRLYFSIYMLITPLGYLTYHKVSILYAEQKSRVRVTVATICQIVFRSLQILSVFIFHGYSIFIVLMIIEQVCCNYICSLYVNKEHDYLLHGKHIELPKSVKQSIYRTVRPIFINNFSANIQTSAKSILIGLLLGNVSIVGYFGNYQLIISVAFLLFSQVGVAFTSSFGNLAVDGDKKHMYHVYRKVIFLLNWIAILLSAGFICCIQDFVFLFFGESSILPYSIIILMTLELLVYLFNMPIITIQNAMGLHKEDQKMMVFQAFTAIILGYILGSSMGMFGLLIGLLLPQFVFTLINKGIIINKKVFDKNPSTFLKTLCCELGKSGFVILFCCLLTSFVNIDNLFLSLVLKAIIVVSFTSIIFYISSRNSIYFVEFIASMGTLLKKSRK